MRTTSFSYKVAESTFILFLINLDASIHYRPLPIEDYYLPMEEVEVNLETQMSMEF